MIFATTRPRAITFVELLIVIIIVGILTGVSVPGFKKTFDNLELENFVKDIYYLSRYLQGGAIGQGKIYCLKIDKDKGEFQATYRQDSEFKNLGGRFGKIYKAPAGITVSVNPPDATGTYFYPDGSVDKITITFVNQHKTEVSLIIKGAAGEIQIK